MKVNGKELRQMIREELLKEQLDHEAIRNVVNAASKLLGALDDFMGNAPKKSARTVHSEVNKVSSVLEDMIKNPMKYIDVVKTPDEVDTQTKVSLD